MTTISLKLPENLLARLERESRARRTTKSSVVRECLEQQLPDQTPPLDLPELPPGESFYDKALPILKKAWARRGRGRATWPQIPNTWKASADDRARGHGCPRRSD